MFEQNCPKPTCNLTNRSSSRSSKAEILMKALCFPAWKAYTLLTNHIISFTLSVCYIQRHDEQNMWMYNA